MFLMFFFFRARLESKARLRSGKFLFFFFSTAVERENKKPTVSFDLAVLPLKPCGFVNLADFGGSAIRYITETTAAPCTRYFSLSH